MNPQIPIIQNPQDDFNQKKNILHLIKKSKISNKTSRLIELGVVVLVVGILIWLSWDVNSEVTDIESNWKTYQNEEYGFKVILPASWKGYLILNKFWNGHTLDGSSVQYQGPKIIIRNPKWTINQPWQDIPILVFTKQEWELIEAQNLGIFAAPIGPSKLGGNQKYIFALPPRWIGFTDDLGQNEAEEIIKTFKIIE